MYKNSDVEILSLHPPQLPPPRPNTHTHTQDQIVRSLVLFSSGIALAPFNPIQPWEVEGGGVQISAYLDDLILIFSAVEKGAGSKVGDLKCGTHLDVEHLDMFCRVSGAFAGRLFLW